MWRTAGHKRKRDAGEDGTYSRGEGDGLYAGNQVLPVADLPSDFNGEPEDGAQYLAMVRRDARARPHTTRVLNPYAVHHAAPSLAPNAAAPQTQLPSVEWRAVFEQRFKDFRRNIRHTPIHVGPPPPRIQLPKWADRDGWWAFINNVDPPPAQTKIRMHVVPPAELDADAIAALVYGSDDDLIPTSRAQAAEVRVKVIADLEDEASDGEIPDDKASDEPAAPTPREPSRALLECINHRTCLRMLTYYKFWVERAAERELTLQAVHGRWMFALLAHIDSQLLAGEMSVLRQVAKACIRLLKVDLDQGDEADSVDESADEDTTGIGRSACWLVIGAVASGFAQRDLWDEAASILTS